MKTDFVEITPIVGQTSVSSHHLFKRNILLVERTGANFNIKTLGVMISSPPGNRETQYVRPFGILRFSMPFNSDEIVKAWYKL